MGQAGTSTALLGWLARWELPLLVAVTLLAAALRFVRLDAIPPGLFYDEAVNGLDALLVLQGDHPIYFEGNQGREPLFIYLVAGSIALFGPGAFPIRLVGAAVGLLTVPVAYLLAREMLGRRVALVSTFLLATSYWHISLSRTGFRAVMLPLFIALASYFWWRGIRQGKLRFFVLSGMALGLSLYTYVAARLFPLFLGMFLLATLLLKRWRADLSLQKYVLGVALLIVTASVVFAPLGAYALAHPDRFLQRVRSAGAQGPLEQGQGLQSLVGQSVLPTLGMFVWQGDRQPRHNLPGRPVFDPLTGIAFLLGLGLCLAKARRPEYLFLVLWMAVMLLPGALSGEAPHFLRTAGVIPAVFLVAGLGLNGLLELAPRWRSATWRPRAVSAAGALVAFVLILGMTLAVRDYFLVWPSRPEVYRAFEADVVDAVRVLREIPADSQTFVSLSAHRDRPAQLALFGEAKRFRSFDGKQCFVWPGDGRETYYVFPGSYSPEIAMLDYLPAGTLERQVLDDWGEVAVQVFRLQSHQIEPPRPQHPLPAAIGEHLELLGYDLPQRARPGEPLRLRLHLRMLRSDLEARQWQFFANLLQPEGKKVWATAYNGGYPTTQWRDRDQAVCWLDLPVDNDCPTGTYSVEFGMFSADTLERLPISDPQGRRIGSSLLLGPVRVAATVDTVIPAVQHPLSVRLGEGISLMGYDLVWDSPHGSGTLELTLYWRALARVPADYTVFVHLVDSQDRLLAQQDNQPQRGGFPTSLWELNEVVKDEYELSVETPPSGSKLSVAVGMYQLSTGQRLPVFDGDGRPLGDHLVLPLTRP